MRWLPEGAHPAHTFILTSGLARQSDKVMILIHAWVLAGILRLYFFSYFLIADANDGTRETKLRSSLYARAKLNEF